MSEQRSSSGAGPVPTPLAPLSPAELATLALMAEGLSNTAISRRRTVSRRTVESTVHAIFSKLRLRELKDLDPRVAAVLVYRSARATVPEEANEVGSALAGAALSIEAARRLLGREPAAADSLLDDAISRVVEAIVAVRFLA